MNGMKKQKRNAWTWNVYFQSMPVCLVRIMVSCQCQSSIDKFPTAVSYVCCLYVVCMLRLCAGEGVGGTAAAAGGGDPFFDCLRARRGREPPREYFRLKQEVGGSFSRPRPVENG